MLTLVIAGPSKWRKSFFPNDVRVGWRMICEDGSPYDLFWGLTPPDKLDALLQRTRTQRGDFDVLDLRERPDDVRDRLWFGATQSAKE